MAWRDLSCGGRNLENKLKSTSEKKKKKKKKNKKGVLQSAVVSVAVIVCNALL